ncbi:MAG: hypothetical protein H6657_00240 [Ardenticatenaceae bacterium]|nr:hypothetical protein [Ardenticatenaceae bacterium]
MSKSVFETMRGFFRNILGLNRQTSRLQETNTPKRSLTASNPIFHWYKTTQLENDNLLILGINSFGNEIRDRYLRDVVLWLLGYDARFNLIDQRDSHPIRAQVAKSPVILGRNIVDLLQARELLSDHELIREIDAKIFNSENSPILWLKDQKSIDSKGFVCWDQRFYDTAVVVEALLEVLRSYPNHYESDLLTDCEYLATNGLNWVVDQLKNPTAPDAMRPWSATLRMLASAVQIPLGANLKEILFSQIQDALLYLHQDSMVSFNSENEKQTFDTSVLNGLAQVFLRNQKILPRDVEKDIILALDHGTQQIEDKFQGLDLWSVQGETHVYLFGSLLLWSVSNPLRANTLNFQAIARIFSSIVAPGEWLYSDGSLAHDLSATSYYIRILVTLAKSEIADIPIPQLYEQLLQTVPNQLDNERREKFELRRQHFYQQQELDELTKDNQFLQRQTQNKSRIIWALTGLFLWIVSFAILAPLLGIIDGLDNVYITNVEALISLATAGAIIVGGIWALSEIF